MERFNIYLAGSCKNEIDEGKGWREKVATIFNNHIESKDYKIVVIDPTKYFSYADRKDHETDKQIMEFYLDQIRHSRIVLVNLNNSTVSVGTGMEIMYARCHDIPIIGFGDSEIYPWIDISCQKTCKSMLEAINYISEYYIERR